MGVWRDPSLVRSHELKKRARAERCRWNEPNERHWRSAPPKKMLVPLTTGFLASRLASKHDESYRKDLAALVPSS
jgi:hypothetical protein